MASHVIRFSGLSNQDRKRMVPLPELADGDHIALHVRRQGDEEQTITLPRAAASVVEILIGHLLRGERVAVLAEEQEVSPTEASTILGISRPLVVHQMDIGDLPFRYVGSHRRALLRDVLSLKATLDVQRKAMEALAEDTEELTVRWGG